MSLIADIEALGSIGRDSRGLTRLAWTPELGQANQWLEDAFESEGLEACIDPAGNVIGRWNVGEGAAVVVGSHIDTVPCGGQYDGALGVLSGLDAVRALRSAGHRPTRPIWIVAFNDEEGARFRTSMLGSRAFTGELELADLAMGGVPEAMRNAGYEFERLAEAKAIKDVHAYLELHIEQGPVLEAADIDIGIVTAIVGLLGLRARFFGEANHAGTTPMVQRRDALAGAAASILALRELALAHGEIVANVGQIRVEPGAANVVPAMAEIDIDLRAPSEEAFAEGENRARAVINESAAQVGLRVDIAELFHKPPLDLDGALQGVLAEAADLEGASHMRMPSGAGHDAMIVGRKVPSAMLFVPSKAGISHSPAEFTEPKACELGARILSRALRTLTSARDPQ